MATGTIKALGINVNSATINTGHASISEGSITWIKIGRVVVVTGSIATSASLPLNTKLATGLPETIDNYTSLSCFNSTSAANESVYVMNTGELRSGGTSSGRLRIAGAYITNS